MAHVESSGAHFYCYSTIQRRPYAQCDRDSDARRIWYTSSEDIIDKTITEIRSENGIKQDMPEDLHQLVQKALALQRHLRTHNTDHRNVRSLELIEAKIHRLSKYYKRNEKIPKNWKYASVIAQLE